MKLLSAVLTPVRITLLFIAALTLLASLPVPGQLLGFEADLYAAGQWWRPFTAWFTQLNFRHWLLNQWGIVGLFLLLPPRISFRLTVGFLVIWLLGSAALLSSNYDNYVGLSGLLYGWLIWGAVISPYYERWVKAVFICIVSGKVLLENSGLMASDEGWVGQFISGHVAHESHLWGWLAGVGVILVYWLALRFQTAVGRHD